MNRELTMAVIAAQELTRYLAMAEALRGDNARSELWLRGAIDALHKTAEAMGHVASKREAA